MKRPIILDVGRGRTYPTLSLAIKYLVKLAKEKAKKDKKKYSSISAEIDIYPKSKK